MKVFDNLADLNNFRTQFDAPVPTFQKELSEGLTFSARAYDLSDHRFTNLYGISSDAPPQLVFPQTLTTSRQLLQSDTQVHTATSGGFFFLADEDFSPACNSLNLAIDKGGQVLSLPVADKRETLVIDERDVVYMRTLGAWGIVLVNGYELTWSSSTDDDTDITVYGNGNSVIKHVKDDTTGVKRILDKGSHFTPNEIPDDFVDLGLIGATDAHLIEANRAKGNLEILSHNTVMRIPEKYVRPKPDENEIVVKEIGDIAVDGIRQAITVGPDLPTRDFASHPINSDESLGGKPPFSGRPIAQNMIFQTEDGKIHTQIFDGRPGSESFSGVTPNEARDIILRDFVVAWGCFLDVGQTANLSFTHDNKIKTYGNRHYAKWNFPEPGQFAWTEDSAARPVANLLTF